MPSVYKKTGTREQYDPDNLKKAVAELKKEMAEGRTGLRKIAKAYGVPKSTLDRYVKNEQGLKGELTFGNKYTANQIFSSQEESALTEYIVSCAKFHYGLTKKLVCELAYQYAVANHKKVPGSWDAHKKAGKDWILGFLRRNRSLSLRTPEPTSVARSMAFNKYNVGLFFKNLKSVMEKYEFTPDCIYNLDETGLTTVQKPARILALKGAKQVSRVTSAERGELVTMCGIVNAMGQALPPFFIFPRVHFKEKTMLNKAPVGSSGTANPSGWMTTEIFIDCLKHFVKFAKCNKESPVLLTMDNHRSHISIEAINYARENGIVMLTLPPHCSGKLQVLDVSVFGPLKTYYNAAADNWMTNNPGKTISIYEICEIIAVAFPSAFSMNNIQAGFQKTGIYPFNDLVFCDSDFASSEVTNQPDLSSPSPVAENDESALVESVQAQSASSSIQPNFSRPATPQPSTSKISLPPPVSTGVSPIDIRPFPKAPAKERKRKTRCQASKIVTSTPEKNKIEMEAAKRMKTPKSAPPKIKKCKTVSIKTKSKKRDILQSSSSEDEAIDVTSGESSEYYESPDEDACDLQKLDGRYDMLKPGTFVLVKFVGGSRKSTSFMYVCSILKAPDANAGLSDASDVEVMAFVSADRERKKFVPKDDDVSFVPICDIVAILPQPELHTKGERVQYNFANPIKDVREK